MTAGVVAEEVKRCRACGEVKPMAEFYLRQVSGTGRINRCRDCDNAKPRSRNAAKILRIRARHRATSELIKRHDGEFRDLLEYFTDVAHEEAEQLAVERAHPNDETPRFRPGSKREGQTPKNRIDVARCSHCVRHHDRGHACAKCGAMPNHALHRPDDGVLDEVAIERRIKGDPVQLSTPELVEAVRVLLGRGDTATAVSKRLHLSGYRVNQIIGQLGERETSRRTG